MLNRTTIMGRLTRDPELRRTGNGVTVTSFRIAVKSDYKDGNDNKKTIYVDCQAWRTGAEYICKYFTKGRITAFHSKATNDTLFGNCLDGFDLGVLLSQYMAAYQGGKDGWKVEACYLLPHDFCFPASFA